MNIFLNVRYHLHYYILARSQSIPSWHMVLCLARHQSFSFIVCSALSVFSSSMSLFVNRTLLSCSYIRVLHFRRVSSVLCKSFAFAGYIVYYVRVIVSERGLHFGRQVPYFIVCFVSYLESVSSCNWVERVGEQNGAPEKKSMKVKCGWQTKTWKRKIQREQNRR